MLYYIYYLESDKPRQIHTENASSPFESVKVIICFGNDDVKQCFALRRAALRDAGYQTSEFAASRHGGN